MELHDPRCQRQHAATGGLSHDVARLRMASSHKLRLLVIKHPNKGLPTCFWMLVFTNRSCGLSTGSWFISRVLVYQQEFKQFSILSFCRLSDIDRFHSKASKHSKQSKLLPPKSPKMIIRLTFLLRFVLP